MACITEAAIGFPNAQRHDPAGERDALRDPGRAGLEHLHGRQVAPVPDRRDEPRLDPAQLADRPRLRALVRLPRRGDQPVVSRTSSTTTTRSTSRRRPRRATTSPRTSPTRRSSSSRTPRRSRRRSRSSCTTRPAPATRRTTRRRSGSTSTRASSTWATRRCARQTLARQKEMGIVPADTELPPINPIGTPETRTGPDGQPFPPLDYTRPWDSLERRREAAVRPDGRGLRRVPRPRRPPDRPAARLPRGDRAAGEHARHRRLRQRRQRRGRPERLGQRDEVRQRHPGRPRREPGHARRARRPEDLQPLPERLGDGVQHAVQDVEALRVQRRHLRPVHHLVAGRDRRRAARSATSTTTRSTSCRPCWTARASSAPETIKGHTQSHFDGVSMRYSFDDPPAAVGDGRPSSTRCSARGRSGTTGWKAVTTHPTISGWGHFNDDEWELYHTDVDRSELHNLAAEHPDKAPRAGEPLVRRGRRERRVPARRPLGRRDPHHPAAPAHRAAQPLRLLPGRAPSVPEAQAVNIRGRSFAIGALVDIPAPGARGRAVRAWLAVRRPRPVREGQPAALREQLRRQRSSR